MSITVLGIVYYNVLDVVLHEVLHARRRCRHWLHMLLHSDDWLFFQHTVTVSLGKLSNGHMRPELYLTSFLQAVSSRLSLALPL